MFVQEILRWMDSTGIHMSWFSKVKGMETEPFIHKLNFFKQMFNATFLGKNIQLNLTVSKTSIYKNDMALFEFSWLLGVFHPSCIQYLHPWEVPSRTWRATVAAWVPGDCTGCDTIYEQSFLYKGSPSKSLHQLGTSNPWYIVLWFLVDLSWQVLAFVLFLKCLSWVINKKDASTYDPPSDMQGINWRPEDSLP